jgi:F-type H+-transporting ATPase subunit b
MVLAGAASSTYARDRMLLAAAPQESPITVDVDWTFLVQLVLFVGLLLILKPILFDPMLKLFAEREKRIDGAKLQARKMDEKSATALAKYEGEMAKARAAASADRDKIRAEAQKREQEILATVRTVASKTLEDGKKAAQIEADKARATLRGETTVMARDLASRVLGREVQS